MTATLTASELATPPPPPFPALDRPLSPDELEAALRSFGGSYYVEHPFHRLMYAGKLTRRQFQGWAANRLAYQRAIPRKDAAIISNCPTRTSGASGFSGSWTTTARALARVASRSGSDSGWPSACRGRRWRTSATYCPPCA